jgi:hypothetical protein
MQKKVFSSRFYSKQHNSMQIVEEKLNKTDARLEKTPKKLLLDMNSKCACLSST